MQPVELRAIQEKPDGQAVCQPTRAGVFGGVKGASVFTWSLGEQTGVIHSVILLSNAHMCIESATLNPYVSVLLIVKLHDEIT